MSKKIKTEQVSKKGNIFIDIDNTISTEKIKELFLKHNIELEKKGSIYSSTINNKECNFLIKNITYLGAPHPLFKKRFQVPTIWNTYIKKKNGFLIGIYSYKKNYIFAFFENKERGKNSSVHISTLDILKATEDGVFKKTDSNNNEMIVVNEDNFYKTFTYLLGNKEIKNKEIELLDDFTNTLDKEWNGIIAYSEMIRDDFSQKYQGEWPGFYLEYNFDNFLNNNKKYYKIAKYIASDKKNKLDFDIEFLENNFFGDLKAHTHNKDYIPLNDKQNVIDAISDYNKLWYIVYPHKTNYDRDFDCEVSSFWNLELNKIGKKKKENSYCRRMKHDISMKGMEMYVLEVNRLNLKYLEDFNQGKQKSGENRKIKYKINKKYLDNFLIHKRKL